MDSERMAARFWPHVDKNGACWLWTGRRSGNGYGQIMIDRRRYLAHRLAWELTNGPIPAGLFVCHACDVPLCCNPSHLWLGTPADNQADMCRKGRGSGGRSTGELHGSHTHPDRFPRGERHGNAKLTDEKVRSIRDAYRAGGITQEQLAARHGVAESLIGMIVRGQIWRHLP